MPIGFHDAYVAALSQKAALTAWGADSNLFARGVAEPVTDAMLIKAPLASPGTVIKVLRGKLKDHLAEADKARAKMANGTVPETRKITRRKKPLLKPSRAALDQADARLATHQSAVEERLAALEQELAHINEEIMAVRGTGDTESRRLQTAIEKARNIYERALEKWRNA